MKDSWNNSRHNEVPNVIPNNSHKNNLSATNTISIVKENITNEVSLEDEIKNRRMSFVSIVSSDSLVSLTETSPSKSKS